MLVKSHHSDEYFFSGTCFGCADVKVWLTCHSVPSPRATLYKTNRGISEREMVAMNQPKMLAQSG